MGICGGKWNSESWIYFSIELKRIARVWAISIACCANEGL